MTLPPHEFIRRFLLHVLPKGFHRIRHYGLFANGGRAENLAAAQALLAAKPVEPAETASAANPEKPEPGAPRILLCPCPLCGGRMIITGAVERGCETGYRATVIWFDTS
jgi:hypothetical protein